MMDRKYLADLRRSPIQRQAQSMLKDLNYEINQIDLSGVLKAHEQRKAGKKTMYKLDKKDEIGKMKKQMRDLKSDSEKKAKLEKQATISNHTRSQSQFF